ncbi:ParB/Srx family N-terminal domain-containing protein [Escherichia sp. TF21-Red]|uniref:ParB/Srx family N-terminal domain-containing protein n=1 Tax=Escherichia sp. TF21-Red TaxID=2870779 RepID=UPI0021AEF33B|nr:ParB N-terminal domain-containing protein [Escherichia sp. TF21-Red]
MSEKLKIVYRPLQELSPYAHNARTHSPEQVAQLVESIKQFGWTNPVLIDEKGEIIAGHGRVMAAEMLKMDSVPVIVLSGLTDEQKKAYRLADNRLPMNAGWDEDLLRMELSDLINADFDVSLTGFIPTEIDELLTDVLPGIYTALDVVSREQVGFIPAVAKNVKADAAAKDQTVTAPVAPEAKTEDIVPGPSAPNTGDQNIGTVDVKITKSKMAPVKWNGEEQLALGPSGTYNTILADQFKQAFRALANEVEADLGALYFGASRAVGTAGTTPFGVKDDLSDAALARQVLEDNGAPTTDLQMVLGSTAIANLRGKQSVLFKVNESGTEQLLREGVLGVWRDSIFTVRQV